MHGPARYRPTDKSFHSFTEEVLVCCPHCSGCARHRPSLAQDRDGWFAPRQLVCPACGYAKEWAEQGFARSSSRKPIDDYFGLPLWLVEVCRGRALWLFNARHLHEFESFVRAGLRERSRDEKFGWSNRAWPSRMPPWLKSAKHRADVLRSIDILRRRIPDWAVYPGPSPS